MINKLRPITIYGNVIVSSNMTSIPLRNGIGRCVSTYPVGIATPKHSIEDINALFTLIHVAKSVSLSCKCSASSTPPRNMIINTILPIKQMTKAVTI